MYEENWSDTLHCLSKALTLDPHWSEVKENLKGTLNYLLQLNEMVIQKGKLKQKKFQMLIDSINKSDLGPYLDGYLVNATNSTDEKKKVELVYSTFKNLEKGLNKNKVILGKVICGGPTKADSLNIVCFNCCISDSNGDIMVLSVIQFNYKSI
jgi:hypothetical protein